MNDLLDGLFEVLGEAAGKVAEIAAEGAGAMLAGTVSAVGAVAESAGPALASAAEGRRSAPCRCQRQRSPCSSRQQPPL